MFAGCSQLASPSLTCLIRYVGCTEGSLPLLKPDLAPKDVLASLTWKNSGKFQRASLLECLNPEILQVVTTFNYVVREDNSNLYPFFQKQTMQTILKTW